METRVICSEMYLTSQELQNLKSKINPKATLNVDIEVENKTSEEQQTTTQTVTNSNSNDSRTKETKSKLKPEVVDGLNKVKTGIPKAMMKDITNSQELRKPSASAISQPMKENNNNSKSSFATISTLKPEVANGPNSKTAMKNMKNSQEFRKTSERAGSQPMGENLSNNKSSMPLAQWKLIFLSMCLILFYMFS